MSLSLLPFLCEQRTQPAVLDLVAAQLERFVALVPATHAMEDLLLLLIETVQQRHIADPLLFVPCFDTLSVRLSNRARTPLMDTRSSKMMLDFLIVLQPLLPRTVLLEHFDHVLGRLTSPRNGDDQYMRTLRLCGLLQTYAGVVHSPFFYGVA